MKRIFYPAIIVAVFLSACQREFTSDVYNAANRNTGNTENTSHDPVTANLQGIIYDENGKPAPGVSVNVGIKSVITNADGFFRIDNAGLDKTSSFVRVQKAGYFPAYRSFCANTGTNQVAIKLLKKNIAGTINTNSGGDVSLSNGSKIGLPASGVVNASSGIAYSGAVTVYATYIDPTADDIAQTIPGSFMANDKDGKRVSLASYGMLAVELESTNGEKLQVAPGKTATLTTVIPASLQTSAPATISLWYVNEQTGIWKEEGVATKIGNHYVGDVKHFSFWNCDWAFPSVTFTLTVLNSEHAPLANALIRVKSRGQVYLTGYSWTDSQGRLTDILPADMILDLSISDAGNNVLYSKPIGPFAKNVEMDITVPTSMLSLVTVKGTVSSCSGKTSSNTYAVIALDNMIHTAAADANGNFTSSFIQYTASSNKAKVYGVDANTLQQGRAINVNITGPVTDAGELFTCDSSVQQYIKYTLDDKNFVILDSLDAYPIYMWGNSGTNSSYILGKDVGVPDYISLSFDNPGDTGTFTAAFKQGSIYYNALKITHSAITLTSFPKKIGQYYEGSFSISFATSSVAELNPIPMTPHVLTGTFKVRRRV